MTITFREAIDSLSEEEYNEINDGIHEYTYKLISYAKEGIPDEELRKLRAHFVLARVGPSARKGYLEAHRSSKLTTADVLYILTSRASSEQISKKFDVDQRKVLEIRAGDSPTWRWEYDLIKRLTAIVRDKISYESKKIKIKGDVKVRIVSGVFTVKKLVAPDKYEILYLVSSERAAKKIVKALASRSYEKMKREGTLDIKYKIEAMEILA